MAIDADEKVIEMKHQKFHDYRDSTYTHNISDHRSLLGTCEESRTFMLKECVLLEVGKKRSVHVNVSTDTIYFGPSSYLRDVSPILHLLEGDFI